MTVDPERNWRRRLNFQGCMQPEDDVHITLDCNDICFLSDDRSSRRKWIKRKTLLKGTIRKALRQQDQSVQTRWNKQRNVIPPWMSFRLKNKKRDSSLWWKGSIQQSCVVEFGEAGGATRKSEPIFIPTQYSTKSHFFFTLLKQMNQFFLMFCLLAVESTPRTAWNIIISSATCFIHIQSIPPFPLSTPNSFNVSHVRWSIVIWSQAFIWWQEQPSWHFDDGWCVCIKQSSIEWTKELSAGDVCHVTAFI